MNNFETVYSIFNFHPILFFKEIVRGRSMDTVLDRLPDVWRDLFLVMDDIKESVRLAAAKTVAALSRACIKMCDVAQSPKSGEAAVRAILVCFSHNQICNH